jgi:HD-like signal output (HDOD) protein
VHDLGRLGLLLTVGQTYEKWVSAEVPNIEESNQLERARFGLNHCEAALMVGEKWGFPELLQTCMVGHHDPDIGPPGAPVPLVQLACRIAAAIGFPEVFQEAEPFPELPDKARACEDLALDRLLERVNSRMGTING